MGFEADVSFENYGGSVLHADHNVNFEVLSELIQRHKKAKMGVIDEESLKSGGSVESVETISQTSIDGELLHPSFEKDGLENVGVAESEIQRSYGSEETQVDSYPGRQCSRYCQPEVTFHLSQGDINFQVERPLQFSAEMVLSESIVRAEEDARKSTLLGLPKDGFFGKEHQGNVIRPEFSLMEEGAQQHRDCLFTGRVAEREYPNSLLELDSSIPCAADASPMCFMEQGSPSPDTSRRLNHSEYNIDALKPHSLPNSVGEFQLVLSENTEHWNSLVKSKEANLREWNRSSDFEDDDSGMHEKNNDDPNNHSMKFSESRHGAPPETSGDVSSIGPKSEVGVSSKVSVAEERCRNRDPDRVNNTVSLQGRYPRRAISPELRNVQRNHKVSQAVRSARGGNGMRSSLAKAASPKRRPSSLSSVRSSAGKNVPILRVALDDLQAIKGDGEQRDTGDTEICLEDSVGKNKKAQIQYVNVGKETLPFRSESKADSERATVGEDLSQGTDRQRFEANITSQTFGMLQHGANEENIRSSSVTEHRSKAFRDDANSSESYSTRSFREEGREYKSVLASTQAFGTIRHKTGKPHKNLPFASKSVKTVAAVKSKIMVRTPGIFCRTRNNMASSVAKSKIPQISARSAGQLSTRHKVPTQTLIGRPYHNRKHKASHGSSTEFSPSKMDNREGSTSPRSKPELIHDAYSPMKFAKQQDQLRSSPTQYRASPCDSPFMAAAIDRLYYRVFPNILFQEK